MKKIIKSFVNLGVRYRKNVGDFFIRVTKVHFGYECHIWNLNHEQALIASWETKKGSLACEEKTFRDSPIFKANPLWNMSRVPIWKKSNAQRRGWCLLLALWTRSYMSVREFYSMLSESNWSNFLNVYPFIRAPIYSKTIFSKMYLFFRKWYPFLQNVDPLFPNKFIMTNTFIIKDTVIIR